MGFSAVFANNAAVTVNGDVKATGDATTGVGGMAVNANSGAAVTVNGNVQAVGSSGIGASASGGGTVTVNGTVTAPIYVQVNGTNKTAAQVTTPTTKTGYATYANGASTVWVAGPAVCSIGVSLFPTLDAALLTVPDGAQTTIKLLADIYQTTATTITNKKITFALNGKNLIFNTSGASAALNLTNSNIGYTGSGSVQVIAAGSNSAVLIVSGGSCKLTYAEGSAMGGVVYAAGGAAVTVNGDVKATGSSYYGIFSNGGTITVNGSVYSPAGAGVEVGGTANVSGNVTASRKASDEVIETSKKLTQSSEMRWQILQVEKSD